MEQILPPTFTQMDNAIHYFPYGVLCRNLRWDGLEMGAYLSQLVRTNASQSVFTYIIDIVHHHQST